VTKDNNLLLNGSAEAHSTVSLFDGAAALGTTTAAGDGFWNLPTGALSDGPHAFIVTATDASGNLSVPSVELDVTIDTTADADASLILSAADPAGGVSTANVAVTLSGIDSDIVSGIVTLAD